MDDYYQELLEARESILFELDEIEQQIKAETDSDTISELKDYGNELYYVRLAHIEKEIADYERSARE